MKSLKKQIPLEILKIVESYMLKTNPLYQLVPPDKLLLKFIDSDKSSDFYFEIVSSRFENNKQLITIKYKPKSKSTVSEYNTIMNPEGLDNCFQKWVDILAEYEKVNTIYDDPIIKKYEEEFFEEYKIIDADADMVSFDLEQQVYLIKYLNKLQKTLNSHNQKEPNNETEKISVDIEELKKDLTKMTKTEIMKKLSKIWAKIRKDCYPVLEKVVIQIKDELVKQLVQKALNGFIG